jgi:DNA replication protein DnaC
MSLMTSTETKSVVLLKHQLKSLRLPTMLGECEKVAVRCARENADHLSYLLQLSELELIDRERRAAERRLKAARFPTHKTLESFDFKMQPSVNRQLINELMRGNISTSVKTSCLSVILEPVKRILPQHWVLARVVRVSVYAFFKSPN